MSTVSHRKDVWNEIQANGFENTSITTAMDILDDGDSLAHYGTPRHSGRYPWGSGDNPYQRSGNFYKSVQDLKKRGMSEKDIAKSYNMSTRDLRAKIANSKIEIQQGQTAELRKLTEKGYSLNAAAKRVGIPESTARNLMKGQGDKRLAMQQATANMLKEQVAKKKYLDIGAGTEKYLGISATKLDDTVKLLEEQGYTRHYIQVEQVGTGQKTTLKVLTKGDVPRKEVYDHQEDIRPVTDVYLDRDDDSWKNVKPPQSVDSSRIKVVYNEEGGINKDGLIQLRRGVDDISLGNAKYAQVRIAVDGTHYLKGMAVYGDDKDFPPGVDILVNSNKHVGTPAIVPGNPDAKQVFKPMKTLPDGSIDISNPFGASIKPDEKLRLVQREYTDANGEKHQSAINVVNEEGDWREWSKTLSSQFLSKQSPALAQRQLKQMYDQKKDEYDEIMSLTNPTVKQHLLESFADDCDASAVSLKAAALPGTASHAILPFPDIKENEIYAPNYKNGDKVVLIRYPHGGQHEIPELTVNNNFKPAKDIIGAAPDAVGIHPKTAGILSGADFDGDTVLVIPNNDHKISYKTDRTMSDELRSVRDFDPKERYPGYPGMKVLDNAAKQKKMGDVSNLITDMTIKGADDDEIARAVRHSMVIIDAEKHKLNWRQSYEDNRIAELKAKYQGMNERGQLKGASTIISRASSDQRVDERKEGEWRVDAEHPKGHRLYYDPETGEKLYTPTGRTYSKGKRLEDGTWQETSSGHKYQQISTKMAEAKDAYTLTSGGSKENPGHRMEAVYAEHANRLKALANQARKSYLATPDLKYDPEARKQYSQEVASLDHKLNEAKKNAPLERQAQLLANANIKRAMEANPGLKDDHDKLKKVKGKALTNARERVGAKKSRVIFTDREWEAVQKGAISNTKLKEILKNADLDDIKQRSMPRTWKGMSPAKISRAKAMMRNGHTQAQVAESLGVSVSTLLKAVNGKGGE